MPVTLPDISNNEAKRLLQVQDKIIKSIPEVEHVLGKAGRANTTTDNAPMSMIETIFILKPRLDMEGGSMASLKHLPSGSNHRPITLQVVF